MGGEVTCVEAGKNASLDTDGTRVIIVHSRSVDSRKLCVGAKYYIVLHMYSMPYYTYGSTANRLFVGPRVLICIYQKNGTVTRINMVLEFFY